MRYCLVIPTQEIGGMEAAIANLANYLCNLEGVEVFLVKMVKGNNNFFLESKVNVIEPAFNRHDYGKLKSMTATITYLRETFKKIKPVSILSFGDRYNSVTVLASAGLSIPVFVSNRMNPYRSNGKAVDLFNLLTYRFTNGIIAQTELAKKVFIKRYSNKNVFVVPNIILPRPNYSWYDRENIILNVGRFNDQKNQHLLIEYFNKIDNKDWQLYFVGDGPNFKKAKELAENSAAAERIKFVGATSKVNEYYSRAKIFAFTSTTEGFPNVLGEAMASGLACMSFDCVSGPSDMINHGFNGYLVDNLDHDNYIKNLQKLITSEQLCQEFGERARKKMEDFTPDKVANMYLNIISA